VAYVLLYLLLRGSMGAQAANAISLLATAIGNTALNRRITFGIRGRAHAARHQVRGLIAFGVGLALTSSGLAALHAVSAQPGRAAELAVLISANLAATAVRFGLYRSWVFRGPARPEPRPGPARIGANGDRHLDAPRSAAGRPAGRPQPHVPVVPGPAGRPGVGRARRCWPYWPRPRCSTWPA
jgi:putative flippase GtrA